MLRPRDLPAAALGLAAGALTARARGRRRLEVANAHARRHLEAELAKRVVPTPQEQRERTYVDALLQRPEPEDRDVGTESTGPIAARLTEADRAAVIDRLDSEPARLWDAANQGLRTRLILSFAVAYDISEALEHTGLSSAMPPDDVHAMARGALVAGGDTFLADLVMGAVANAGLALPPGGRVLDFGSSSGRVIRMIAAGRPDASCLACDPNSGAIAWAAEHLPGIEFFVSPLHPPLDLESGSLDLVYAISIWSHFAAEAGLAWLSEMHRVLRPGGALVMTTHGFDCLATRLRRGDVSAATAAEAAAALIASGHHFVDVFGEEGDWGVKDPGWGEAYFTLDWLMSNAGGAWSARLLWPGVLDRTQDLVVLERQP